MALRGVSAGATSSSPNTTHNVPLRASTTGGGARERKGENRMKALDEWMERVRTTEHFTQDATVVPMSKKPHVAEDTHKQKKDEKSEFRRKEERLKRGGMEANQAIVGVFRSKMAPWIQLADRSNKRLRRENEALSKIALLTQENSINNDHRYEEALSALRSELEYTVLARQQTNDTSQVIKETSQLIHNRISQVRGTAERLAQTEHSNVKEAFERQIELQQKELEDERERGKDTTGQWVDKNREVQAELEMLLFKTEATHTRHKDLKAENNALQVNHDAQASDADLLSKQLRLVQDHHQQLRDRIHDLEVELANQQNTPGGFTPDPDGLLEDRPDGAHSASPTKSNQHVSGESVVLRAVNDATRTDIAEGDRARSYAAGVRKAKMLLEAESNNLRAVRHAHVLALKQRTELEVYLRQEIIRHQRTKKGEAKALDYTAFTADDRRQVVERMLSRERVLYLMYDESRGKDDAPQTSLPEIGGKPVIKRNDAQTEMQALWEKWKRWTEEASQPEAPPPQHQ